MGTTRRSSCQVCRHPERIRIEDAKAAGCTLVEIEAKYGVEKTAIHRHWHDHVPAERKVAYLAGKKTIDELRKRAVEENASLLDYLSIVRSVLTGQLLAQAEMSSVVTERTAGRLIECLKEIGFITGEIERAASPSITVNNTVAVSSSPGFPALMEGLIDVCRAHPEARADIVALLRRIEPSKASKPEPVLIEHAAVAA